MKITTIISVLIVLSLCSSSMFFIYYAGYLWGAPKVYRLSNKKLQAYKDGEMTRDEYITNVRPWLCNPKNARVLQNLFNDDGDLKQVKAIIAVQGMHTVLPKTPEGEYDFELIKC